MKPMKCSVTPRHEVYDQYGHEGLDANNGAGRGGAGGFGDIFGDVFGDIFGGGRGGRGGPARGSDLRYNMALSLEQAVDAVEIRIPVLAACEDCDGSGANRAPLPRPVRIVMAQAKFACLKVSFRCSKPAHAVVAEVR